MEKIETSGGLDGIKYQFAQLGLNGSLSDYFTYKLTNVTRTDISKTQADRILDVRGGENDCAGWRDSMRGLKWGVYQILAISVGDIRYSRNKEFAASADVKAKLATFEPALKASLKKSSGLSFSGTGLVVSFQPVLRN